MECFIPVVTSSFAGSKLTPSISSKRKTSTSPVCMSASSTTTNNVNGRDIGSKAVVPVGTNLLVELEERQNVSSGGIIITGSSSKSKRRTGHVLAVGPGSRFVMTGVPIPMPIKVGERVVFGVLGNARGLPVKYNDKDCLILALDEVLGHLPDTATNTNDASQIIPFDDKLIVKVDKRSDMTVGGIALAENALGKSRSGVVLRMGQGKLLEDGTREPIGVKEGDRILWTEYSGNEIENLSNPSDKYTIIRARDIVATL